MENSRVGYIYIRTHSSFDVENACKLGKTNNLPERDSQYATGEVKRGVFYPVFEIPIEKVGFVERLLQYEFQQQNYHIQYNAGTEFYNKCIICLIEPFLQNINISYKSLTPEEIDKQVRINRVKKHVKK